MQYKIIGILAMVLTPIAPSTFFGWRVYEVVTDMSGLQWLSIGAAVASVVGLEAVGIIAGHTAVDSFRLQKYEAAVVSTVVMVAYVAIGVYELWGTIGAIIFLIAPLAYIAVAMRETLAELSSEKKQEIQQKYDFRAAQLAAQVEIKKAEIEANTKLAVRQVTRQDAAQVATGLAAIPTDWRQVTDGQKAQLAALTRGEREKHMQHIAARTRRAWHERLDNLTGSS